MFKWIRKWFGDDEGFKNYYFKGSPDTYVLYGRKVATYKLVGNWDSLWVRTAYLRPDGTYSVCHEIHDIGINRSFEHGLTTDQIREKHPGLAKKMGLVEEVSI